KEDVLFPFGHGLSYTSFEFSNLVTDRNSFPVSSPSVSVSVEIRNTGSVKGDEVVQLYLKDLQSEEIQASKKLRDFRRVTLERGESEILDFKLVKDDFTFWSEENQRWTLEPGEFEILVGSSSEDIRITKTVSAE
ncbi:MAG: fibronectin type III-like domain-contianing protein, partial [Bacteroidales bacterium]|nr:fibronectin type III-like domain-contianing protein [Bacteroidales bacterium]